MLARHPRNPLLTPSDIPPSRPSFEVLGVFNAGATLVGKNTLLVLRVSERPRARKGQTIRIPWLQFRKGRPRLTGTTLSTNDRRYDFSEPAVVWTKEEPRKIVYLTSLSHLRRAWSDDGIHFRVEPRPWIFPGTREEAWGCEDARVTKIGTRYWVNYTAVSDLGISTALASTKDFHAVERHGIILPPANRDMTVFPERSRRAYAAFHRPMPAYIGDAAIWYAESPDLRHWGDHRVVAGPRPGRWDGNTIGSGAPPIRTPAGWLSIYHGVDVQRRYSLGALLTDLRKPWNVLARSRAPLLAPTAAYERRGFVPNVCFTCGAVVRGRDLWIYYGAADRVIALATVPVREVLRTLSRA